MARERISADVRRTSDVIAEQVRAIDAFHGRARALAEGACGAHRGSRESRMDAARRLDVLRRQHEALVARADRQLAESVRLLHVTAAPRAVLAHSHPWFVDKLADGLARRGVDVVAVTANGADAVGIAVAEQPDVVLVGDTMEMLGGVDVVRTLGELAPRSVLAAQVAYEDRVEAAREAGAVAVFTRQVPPDDVAAQLCLLLSPARQAT